MSHSGQAHFVSFRIESSNVNPMVARTLSTERGPIAKGVKGLAHAGSNSLNGGSQGAREVKNDELSRHIKIRLSQVTLFCLSLFSKREKKEKENNVRSAVSAVTSVSPCAASLQADGIAIY
jgi:hypothetical protein